MLRWRGSGKDSTHSYSEGVIWASVVSGALLIYLFFLIQTGVLTVRSGQVYLTFLLLKSNSKFLKM